MNNGNIIDLVVVPQEKASDPANECNMLSEDLQVAIEILIERLRNHEPVKAT